MSEPDNGRWDHIGWQVFDWRQCPWAPQSTLSQL